MTTSRPVVCVIGAGPTGLEAATLLVSKGFRVTCIEKGDGVGASVQHWGHVRLFSSNRLNCSAWGLSACAAAGAAPLHPDARPTGREYAEGYLVPMAEQLQAAGDAWRLHTCTRVVSISRGAVLKNEAVKAVGETERDRAPFTVIACATDATSGRDVDDSDFSLSGIAAVIDCSGTYGLGNSLGAGGAPALGERGLRASVALPQRAWFDTLPDVCGRDKQAFLPSAGVPARRIVLVGGGYSAATTLLSLVELARAETGIALTVDWLLRRGPGVAPYARVDDDPLPARAALVDAANALAAGEALGELLPPNLALRVHRGVVVEECRRAGALRVKGWARGEGGEGGGGDEAAVARAFDLEADVLVSHVGYRPDTALARELQLHTCYASEGPMKLAASLLAARVAAKGRGAAGAASDCLNQAAPGPDLMRNPEPQFFVCGAKSYGRNSAFLLTLGHAQVEAVVGILETELAPPPPC